MTAWGAGRPGEVFRIGLLGALGERTASGGAITLGSRRHGALRVTQLLVDVIVVGAARAPERRSGAGSPVEEGGRAAHAMAPPGPPATPAGRGSERPSGRALALGALRPSAIAHTIRDWPRCMSPAVNTPGTLVIQSASRHTLPRSVRRRRALEHAGALRPEEAHGQEDQLAGQVNSAAGISRKTGRPPSRATSTRGPPRARGRGLARRRGSASSTRRRRARRPPRGPRRRGRCSATGATGCRRARWSGGAGRISIWCTERAPWRCTVPEAVRRPCRRRRG